MRNTQDGHFIAQFLVSCKQELLQASVLVAFRYAIFRGSISEARRISSIIVIEGSKFNRLQRLARHVNCDLQMYLKDLEFLLDVLVVSPGVKSFP